MERNPTLGNKSRYCTNQNNITLEYKFEYFILLLLYIFFNIKKYAPIMIHIIKSP